LKINTREFVDLASKRVAKRMQGKSSEAKRQQTHITACWRNNDAITIVGAQAESMQLRGIFNNSFLSRFEQETYAV